MQQNKIFSK